MNEATIKVKYDDGGFKRFKRSDFLRCVVSNRSVKVPEVESVSTRTQRRLKRMTTLMKEEWDRNKDSVLDIKQLEAEVDNQSPLKKNAIVPECKAAADLTIAHSGRGRGRNLRGRGRGGRRPQGRGRGRGLGTGKRQSINSRTSSEPLSVAVRGGVIVDKSITSGRPQQHERNKSTRY